MRRRRLAAAAATMRLLVLAVRRSCAPRARRLPPTPSPTPLYQGRRPPVEARVDDLLQAHDAGGEGRADRRPSGSKTKIFDAKLQLDPAKLGALYPEWHRPVRPPVRRGGPVQPARRARPRRPPRRSRWSMRCSNGRSTQTRLGIPILFHEEGLHGYAALGATSFPQAIALASIVGSGPGPLDQRGHRARNARARRQPGAVARWSMSRAIRAGAGSRRPSAKTPIWSARWASRRSKGCRAPASCTLAPGKVFATLKHLTGHGQPESGTNVGPAPISERELRENFFPPFEQVVKRTGIRRSCPRTTRSTACRRHANKWLLRRRAARRMGLQGRGGQRLFRDRPVDEHPSHRRPIWRARRRSRTQCRRRYRSARRRCPTPRSTEQVRDGQGARGGESTPPCAGCSK